MKIAVVHDWLTVYAGAERVLEQMLLCFPEADLYSLIDFVPQCERLFLLEKSVKTSFIQKLPFAKRNYRSYFPLMPPAIEQFDLSGYDLVISSSFAVAKGVITGPEQLHLCMCYSPARYAWDLQHQYLRESGLDRGFKGWAAKWFLHKFRIWDVRTAHGVDHFIAISKFIEKRIRKVYGRDSVIIYPPVDSDFFTVGVTKDDFYLTASRMVPYKKIDLIVEAFARMPEKRLVVIGEGPEMAKVRSNAGKNVEILGYRPAEVLRDYLQRARAFVFAAEEDFGIAPLEAQACGTPVIAYGRGGALETVKDFTHAHPTGVFFDRQDAESLTAAVGVFERNAEAFSSSACRENALLFSQERFREEFSGFVRKQILQFHGSRKLRSDECRPRPVKVIG